MKKIPRSVAEQINNSLSSAVHAHGKVMTSTSPSAYNNKVNVELDKVVDLCTGWVGYEEFCGRILECQALHRKVSAPQAIRRMKKQYNEVQLKLELLANEWEMLNDDPMKGQMQRELLENQLGELRIMTREEIAAERRGPSLPPSLAPKPVVDDSKNKMYGDEPFPGEPKGGNPSNEVSPPPGIDARQANPDAVLNAFLKRGQSTPAS